MPYEDALGLLWSTVFVMSDPDEVVSQPRDALWNMGLVVVGDEVLGWTRDDQADALLRHIARFILHGHDMRSVVESELADTGLWDRETGEFVSKIDDADSESENDSTADVVVDADADADAEFDAEIDQAEKLVEQWLVDWRNYHRNDDHLWN